MTLGVDPLELLKVVDYGDAAAAPADLPPPARGARRAPARDPRRRCDAARAGRRPLAVSAPTLRVLAERHGADGYAVLHLDTHADTADELYGVRISHGTPFRIACDEGALKGGNVVQVGLRGTWPGPELFEWMRSAGFRWHTMDEIVERGLVPVVSEAIGEVAAAAPRLSDRGHRRARPGVRARHGHARARRADDARAALGGPPSRYGLDLCAADVVEVSPPYDQAGITALAAERVALEILAGIAAGRRG